MSVQIKSETEILNETLPGAAKAKWSAELRSTNAEGKFDLYKAFNSIPRTEVTTAEAIAAKLKNNLCYVPESKTWYLWDGKIHRPCHADGIAIKVVQAYYEVLTDTIAAVSATIDIKAKMDGNEAVKPLRAELSKHKNFRDRLATDAGQKAVVSQMKTKMDVQGDHFSDDRRWFVVENGVFDMEEVRATRQFVLKPHDASRPVYRMWHITDDPTAKSPSLNKFLTGSIADRGQGEFFSKAVALACMGAPVSTRTIVSLQGARRSGKSMINRAIGRLTGDNGIYAEPPRDAIVKNGRNPHHARYSMKDARYVAFTEITDRLDREFVLKYTGGDRFPVEQKYVAGTQVVPQGIIFMASNHGMDIDKTDEAIFERIAPINFPRTFEKVSVDGTHILDPDLEDKIVAEASGFLNWLKWAYLEYLENGLDRTDSMEALKREERDDELSVVQYVKDRIGSGFLREAPDAKLSECANVTTVYADYLQWCTAYGVPRDSQLKRKQFGIELGRTYPKADYQTTRFSGLVCVAK
jgi:phage/plasmid-associated DNA primase